MKSIQLRNLLTVFLVSFALLITPTDALAVPIQNLNGQTGSTQTFANDTNVTISSVSNVHSLGWNGILSVLRGGTGASSFSNGSLLFFNGSTFAQNNSNLFWDNANNRLGIGTTSPSGQLHLGGTGQAVTDNYGLLIDDKTAGTNNYNIWSGPPGTSFDPYIQPVEGAKNIFTSHDSDDSNLAGLFVSQGENDAAGVEGIAVTTGNSRAFAGAFENMAIGTSDKG